MNGIIKAIDEISAKAGEKMQYNTFYLDDKGLRRCKVCKRKLETLINIPSLGVFDKKVNCVCDCGKAQRDAYRAEAKRIERANETSADKVFSVPEYASMTFSSDRAPKSENSILCRRWVAHYDANRAKGNLKWLFLYGKHGTGKTFYAACIANAMAARGYVVKLVTASEIVSKLINAYDKSSVYSECKRCELLIIEDFDVDNSAADALFTIINNRHRNNQATILTSGMTTEQTVNANNASIGRIMQIIWDRCYPIEFKSGG